MFTQLPLFCEPAVPLPYGTCPTCGAAAGFSLWGPDRPAHPVED